MEGVLRDKITEYWKPFYDTITKMDPDGERLITPRQLKKALDRHILPIGDDHFEKYVMMWSGTRVDPSSVIYQKLKFDKLFVIG